MPASLNFKTGKGEDILFTGTHYTDSTETVVVNITGWTILLTFKDMDGNAKFTKTGTVLVGLAGTYTWSLDRADTINEDSEALQCDAWRTDTGGQRWMGQGFLYINPDTRNGGA